MGRATVYPRGVCRRIETFQSTPSVGRATLTLLALIYFSYISIHALRGEGDAEVTQTVYFITNISIHALRGEGDSTVLIMMLRRLIFQSTPSVGRATNMEKKRRDFEIISIHALRGEGDSTFATMLISVLLIFQSTPSVGRATVFFCPVVARLFFISIHALRGEGDAFLRYSTKLFSSLFQSTPSVGRATTSRAGGCTYTIFQSTPSVGRATISD